MTNANIWSLPVTAGDRQFGAPATRSGTDLSPDVTGFYDTATCSVQYVVVDPITADPNAVGAASEHQRRSAASARR
jgi:hypothetical protein